MSPSSSQFEDEDSSDRPTELLAVGRATKAHGLQGEIAVQLTTNRRERLNPGSVLFTDDDRLEVISSRPKGKNHLVTFAGRTSRESVEPLQGRTLHAAPLDDADEMWVHELIGATVIDQTAVARGTVVSVEANPASDLLVLEDGALVPARFIVERDADVLTVHVPDGLFDL